MRRLLHITACSALASALSAPAPAQTADSSASPIAGGRIDTVLIAGNERTKDYVILNEMTLKAGMTATPEAMEYDRNRIYSLGLFTTVDVEYDSLKSLRFLFVHVRERWYIIPFPQFGFRDGDPKKVYYGAGFLDYNFRGRNQKLYGAVAFGFDPSLELAFTDPLFVRAENLYFAAGLSTSQVRNRSLQESAVTGDFNERHYDVNATLGKRFTLYEMSGVNVGYHVVKVSSYRPGRTASTRGLDKYLYATVDYTYDSRDLREYPMQGAFYWGYLTKDGFGESEVNFVRIGADLRRYTPLPWDLSLAARLYGSLVSGGDVPTYARAYLGYGDRIRGYFKEVYEGENVAGATLELRYPLLKPRTIIFSAISIPQEFAVWRFGVSLALFADAGRAWFRGEKPSLASIPSGYGAAIAFLLPYDAVIQTAYAFNTRGRGEFILDFRRPI